MFDILNNSTIYFYIAIVGTILFLFRLFAMFLGNEFDTDFDSHNDYMDSDHSFELLSSQSIFSFLMGYGWMGQICLNEWNKNGVVTFLFSLAFGFAMMLLMAIVMCQVKRLNKHYVFDPNTLIGTMGKAYTTLKPNEVGQIQVNTPDGMLTVNAISQAKENIPSFAPIKVVRIEDKMPIVDKV